MEAKLERLNKCYKRKRGEASIGALCIHYWTAYRIESDSRALLSANSVLMYAAENGGLSQTLRFLQCFIHLELRDFDAADEFMRLARRGRNYYKNYDTPLYCAYLFLDAYADIQRDRTKQAARKLPLLEEAVAEQAMGFPHVMLAALRIHLDDALGARLSLESAYDLYDSSCFFYVCCYEYFLRGPRDTDGGERLLSLVMKWGSAQRINMDGLLTMYQNKLVKSPELLKLHGRMIYEEYKYDWMLSALCEYLIGENDLGRDAFDLYREAEKRQLDVAGLQGAIIAAAMENSYEAVSRYTLERFLSSGTADKHLLCFAYHLVISRKENSDLLSRYSERIVLFGAEHIGQSGFKRRYFNSVLKLLAEIGSRPPIGRDTVNEARKFLLEDLFSFELTADNPAAKSVWIYEKELRDMRAYAITGGTADVRASGADFEYFLMGEGQKSIVQATVKIKSLVEQADTSLYKQYLNPENLSSEEPDTELLAALGRAAIEELKPGGEWIPALLKARKDPRMSRTFKMMLGACLANIYSGSGDQQKAVNIYVTLDENCLNDDQLEQMLLTYVNHEEFSRAASLILRKGDNFSEKALFYSIKRVSHGGERGAKLASMAFKLILGGWYDKELLDLVLGFHSASQREWHSLSETLDELGVADPGLEELILRNSIWMHECSQGSQAAFARLYERDSQSGLARNYIEYLCYELLVNAAKLEHGTIDIMERDCESSARRAEDKELTRIALCHYYIQNGAQTPAHDGIIAETAESLAVKGLSFPIFRQIKDKRLVPPYIEKTLPFMYRGKPEMSVKLYYKYDDEDEFRVKSMDYFKFGIYVTNIPVFYKDRLIYYYSEESIAGSVSTMEQTAEPAGMNQIGDEYDPWHSVNNAVIYEQLFRYELVEEIVTKKLAEKKPIRARVM